MDWTLALQLAQEVPGGDQALDWSAKAAKAGPTALAILVAGVAGAFAVWQINLRISGEKEKTELEKQYRTTIETKAKDDQTAADKRLADQKAEADRLRDREAAAFKERLQSEKESDVVLAGAVRALEAATKLLDRVERLLERVEKKLEK